MKKLKVLDEKRCLLGQIVRACTETDKMYFQNLDYVEYSSA